MSCQHRILVTGASGFVGRWLRRELEERQLQPGIDLVVLTANDLAAASLNATDISDKRQATALIQASQPTAIIHLAAIAAPGDARKVPERAWDVNFRGTMNLAYAAMELVPNTRFIFAGSSEAYGASFIEGGGIPIGEDAALKPMSVYGATKAAADIMLGQLAYEGLKAIRFRPFNHTGPGQTDAYVVPAFARQIADILADVSAPRISVGNLSAYRDFLDVRDVVRAYADAALNEVTAETFGKAFNLASGHSTQIQTILDVFLEIADVPVEVIIDPTRLRPSDIPVAAGNSDAAYHAFGWKPEIALKNTLKDVLAYWKMRTVAE